MIRYSRRLIDQVTGAAQHAHGRHATRAKYQATLAADLQAAGLAVRLDVVVPAVYGGDVEVAHCLDLIVATVLGVELRAVETVLPVTCYLARLECYLRLSGLSHGLLLDFTGAELIATPVTLTPVHGVAS